MTVNRLERKARTDSAATTKTDPVSGESHKSYLKHTAKVLLRVEVVARFLLLL